VRWRGEARGFAAGGEEGSGLVWASDSSRISGVSYEELSLSRLMSSSRLSRFEAHSIWMASGTLGSSGHVPDPVLSDSLSRSMNWSGESRESDLDKLKMMASVGESG
jgi:hypothetical protein